MRGLQLKFLKEQLLSNHKEKPMPSENIKFSQPTATSKELDLYDLHLLSSKYHTLPDLSELIGKKKLVMRLKSVVVK